jgi:hypothetical protein
VLWAVERAALATQGKARADVHCSMPLCSSPEEVPKACSSLIEHGQSLEIAAQGAQELVGLQQGFPAPWLHDVKSVALGTWCSGVGI